MRFGLQDAELLEPLLDELDAFGRCGRQRRAGRTDRPPHDDAPALERRRILIAEDLPKLRELVLAFARARPISVRAGLVKRDAEVRTDCAGGGIGARAAQRD